MFTEREREVFLETGKQATRWYCNTQCTTTNAPWNMRNSADNGRFIYEYYPAHKKGSWAGIWAQALGIMALDSISIKTKGEDCEEAARREAALLAGEYIFLLQHTDKGTPKNYGGFSESTPKHKHSFPRDGITGAMGMSALYRMTEEEKYLESARIFADWYRNSSSDEDGWPYLSYDFDIQKGCLNPNEIYKDAQGHNRFVKGDWQVGGALFYYQLAKQTGDKKYIDEYMVPLMDQLMVLYNKNPVTEVVHGFHGFHPVSFGNDDFALVSMLCAYCATGDEKYYTIARDRIIGLLDIMDDCGSFPSLGGTFTMGITIKNLIDLQKAMGFEPDERLLAALRKVAMHGTELQAYDYNDIRVHGGFWGQTSHGVSRDRIHQRSTGYATIFYAMIAGEENNIPYYNCLNWGYEPKPVK